MPYRYTGVTPSPPPGNTHSSPSEDYWTQMDLQVRVLDDYYDEGRMVRCSKEGACVDA